MKLVKPQIESYSLNNWEIYQKKGSNTESLKIYKVTTGNYFR